MKQRTNSFTIHSFHLNFPNFIPEIIRPLYISTSILSTFFPWNREYVKINSLLIPYFSEFSFFFKSKTRKKKRTNLLLFKFTKFHSLLNRLYLFQQSSSHRETKNGQSRFSSISYLSANFFSQLSSPRFLTNIYTMKHTEGGGGRQSRFPSISCPNSPLLHCPPLPLSKTWKTGGIIIGNDPRRNADMLHLFEHRAAEFNLGL